MSRSHRRQTRQCNRVTKWLAHRAWAAELVAVECAKVGRRGEGGGGLGEGRESLGSGAYVTRLAAAGMLPPPPCLWTPSLRLCPSPHVPWKWRGRAGRFTYPSSPKASEGVDAQGRAPEGGGRALAQGASPAVAEVGRGGSIPSPPLRWSRARKAGEGTLHGQGQSAQGVSP